MQNRKFERSARANRAKAFMATLLFHSFLIGGLTYSGELNPNEYLPKIVKDWIDIEAEPVKKSEGPTKA